MTEPLMVAALDTSVLACAEGAGDPARCERARALVSRILPQRILLPAQVLGELNRVLTGTVGLDAGEARTALLSWADAFEIADPTWSAFQGAVDLAADHRLQIRDALNLSVAAEHGSRLLLSEDLQDGFTWHGVTVLDPFAGRPSPLLGVLLDGT